MSAPVAFPHLPPPVGESKPEGVQRQLYEFARRLLDFLKTTPDTEYKTITTVGNFPLQVSTRINTPIEVRRCQTYESRNTSNAVSDVSIAWRLSSDPRLPGIIITDMGGLTLNTDYTVVLAIAGVR